MSIAYSRRRYTTLTYNIWHDIGLTVDTYIILYTKELVNMPRKIIYGYLYNPFMYPWSCFSFNFPLRASLIKFT